MSNISSSRRLGQVFLQDQNIISKIISTASIKPDDLILEIGPGKGILTNALLKTKANVLAIEKDPNLVKLLKKRFASAKNFEVVQADIRDFLRNPKLYVQYPIFNTKYKVIGNIPYYLTSYLIRLLLETSLSPSLIVLMVQKEVAQRIIAQPPKMNLLAVSVQYYSKPEIIKIVPSRAFSPQPKVDSAIIKITPFSNETLEATNFFKVVRAGFNHPRKLLLNNLPYNLKIPKAKLQIILKELKLPPNTRAQNLSIAQWKELVRKIASLIG